MPRALLLVLLGLLALLQYQLWLGDGGITERRSLESQVMSDSKENRSLRQRNEALADRVIELQEGDEMLEDKFFSFSHQTKVLPSDRL